MTTFSEDAIRILEKRYLLRDPSGKVTETPDEMLRRVAVTVAGEESDKAMWEESFYELMAAHRFLPNSPTLANAGRPKGQLAACFVLPVEDSIEGIFETMKRAALIHKTGGGTGFSFSKIRPREDAVSSTGGIASGPLSFIRAYNCATDAIKQGGMRRGANMAVLDYWHPDIFDFIQAKKEEGALTNFNFSVGVDEVFMSEAARGGEIDLLNPRTGRPTGQRVSASSLFDIIVKAAWENGEPGILFFDHINAANTVPGCGPLRATNPCGEQPLFDYESCNLGSLNLPLYLTEAEGDFRGRIDWGLLGRDVYTAVRFLDNVIDVNHYVFPEIKEMTAGNRKIGLGVMGFADMLVELGIPYASDRALELTDALMGFIKDKCNEASTVLGWEKGCFPNIDKSIYQGKYRRNATLTTIAPTGTLSMLVESSSGIEPLFGLNFVKEALDGKHFSITNSRFEKAARKRGFWSRDLMDEVALKGGLKDIDGIPGDIREVFATGFEISPAWHIKVQAAFQKHVDNAVSKTINFPPEASVDDIKSAYMQAWREGCKGLTIYRMGSRENQVLKFTAKDRERAENPVKCLTCMD
ncbi:MAG: ribonucleoside-diphosphate reductase, adenosylcobalamin-dependent [Firmicutes bacterium HGW-Firmicutes-8]|nr:MAG: ribonucleoside-diphosphate reductase, adenosylcobalamin-dependent [Firmicutes bacterium HGW-Firmicutes-8]